MVGVLNLSPLERSSLINQANDLLPLSTFMHMTKAPNAVNRPPKWHVLDHKQGVHISRASGFKFGASASMTILFSLEKVLNSVLTDTTEGFRDYMKQTCPNTFVDGYIVENLVPRSQTSPWHYIGIKYMVIKLPGCKKARDFVFLEKIGLQMNSKGHPMAYRVMQSIDLKDNEPISIRLNRHIHTRGQLMDCGYFFQPNAPIDPSEQCALETRFYYNGDLFINERAIVRQIQYLRVELLKLVKRIDSNNLATLYFFQEKLEKQHYRRFNCQICLSKFNMLRHCHYCDICGEAICSKCSVKRDCEIPLLGKNKLRVCNGCGIKSSSQVYSYSGRCNYSRSIDDEKMPMMCERSKSKSLLHKKSSMVSNSTVLSSSDTVLSFDDLSSSTCEDDSMNSIQKHVEPEPTLYHERYSLYTSTYSSNDILEISPSLGAESMPVQKMSLYTSRSSLNNILESSELRSTKKYGDRGSFVGYISDMSTGELRIRKA